MEHLPFHELHFRQSWLPMTIRHGIQPHQYELSFGAEVRRIYTYEFREKPEHLLSTLYDRA